jgi:methyltransferase (TIGR00027 family)
MSLLFEVDTMDSERTKHEKTVNRESPSKMAEGIAMQRFAESSKGEDKRICYDPYAVHFISPQIIEYGIKHPEEAKAKVDQMEKLFPGLSSSIIIRVRYFDDYIEKLVNHGLEQLVILGAGYDTRAYRITGLNQVTVFEVDHPNTQSFKIEKINQILEATPDNVVYVPVDFETEDLGPKLFEYGYDPLKKTLFVMEGLVMYIPEESVLNTLKFIKNNSGKGSSIIFDYYPSSVVDGTCKQKMGHNIRNFVKDQGEPLQFGIVDGKLEEFLSNRGFKNIRNVSSDDYQKLYCRGKNVNREVCDLLYFAHAEVE